MPDVVTVSRLEVIESPELAERIWAFYYGLFSPLNRKTPLSQYWPKDFFMPWMTDQKMIKFLAMQEGEVIGFGVVTNQIRTDWLLSPEYFEEEYPGRPIYHCPVIAVKKGHAGLGALLLQTMFRELPAEGVGVFLHSKTANGNIPLFAERAGKGRLVGTELDAEACHIFEWRDAQKVELVE